MYTSRPFVLFHPKCMRSPGDRQTDIDLPIPPLTLAPLPATHTILPLSRGIDGEFSTWREALAPKPPAHPALSSSTTRAPGSSKNFVRGKGSYAPFTPGGLEEAASVPKEDEDAEEADEEEEEGWKTRAPGLKRGVQLSGGKSTFDHGSGLPSGQCRYSRH